jgi:EPS-associated MarR family transcriptional regulator
LLEEKPGISQRALDKEAGMSVRGVNYFISALAAKGWIEVGNFSKNPNRLSYALLSTPIGVAEKFLLPWRFWKRSMVNYEKLRCEIEALPL